MLQNHPFLTAKLRNPSWGHPGFAPARAWTQSEVSRGRSKKAEVEDMPNPPFRESGFCFQSSIQDLMHFLEWLIISFHWKCFIVFFVFIFCNLDLLYIYKLHGVFSSFLYITFMFSSSRFHWVLLIPILIQWDMWWQWRKQLRSPASLKDLTFAQQQELGAMARGARFLREKTRGFQVEDGNSTLCWRWCLTLPSGKYTILVAGLEHLLFFHILDLVGWLEPGNFMTFHLLGISSFVSNLFFSIQLGISSSQLTWTPWFFRGVGQPSTRSIVMAIYGKFQ